MSNTTTQVDGSPILNPFTPLALLPPDLAYRLQVSRYILVGTLGAFLWDIINNIKSDCKLVSKHRTGLQTAVYFISKLSSFGYVLGSTIFETAPISSCAGSQTGLGALFSFAVPSTSLLFFFRVRAVFGMNPWAVAFFGVLWLVVLVACLTTFDGASFTNIEPTHYCIATGTIRPYVSIAIIIPLINDTIIFLAITWRLRCNSYACQTIKDGFRVCVFGDYLPTFSRLMLQDGQVYYLTTVTANLITVVVLCITSLPDTYRTMFTVPNVTLMNIMACRVYRNTLFGLIQENRMPSITSRDLRAANSAGISLSVLEAGSRTKHGVPTSPNATPNATVNEVNGIMVTKMIELTVEDCRTGNKETEVSRMV